MTRLENSYITYEELSTHSTYSDAWISINGIIYDITNFIDQHPFGDTFRGNLGTECGGLFSSSHSNTNVEKLLKSEAFLKHNKIVKIGRLDLSRNQLHKHSDGSLLDRIIFSNIEKDEFWQDLKTQVTAFIKDNNETVHYSTVQGFGYVVYYLLIYLLLSYLTWAQGSFIAAILLGIHMICMLANIAHMATHYGFTKNQPLNFLAMHLFDLSGMSGLEWQITHQTHHHQPHSSIDYQTNVYGYIGARIHKYIQHKPYHKYQKFYFWLTVSAYLLFKFFATSIWLYTHREFIRHHREVFVPIFARVILLAQIVYCATTLGLLAAIGMILAYSIAFSQTAFILLFNDHEDTHALLGEVEDINEFHDKISWAETQAKSSNNWYPTGLVSAFFEFHYGYFNYHIEHHLFPSFKPSLLKKISPIVKNVCREHNVPYISTTFTDVQKSLQSHITKLSLETI